MRNRITPHKPQRDEVKTKEVVELKRENHQLKRKVKRLEKEISKRIEVEEDVAEDALSEQEVIAIRSMECPSCGEGPVVQLSLGPSTFSVCKACKWRKKAS